MLDLHQRKRAPLFMGTADADALKAGELLCSEPWNPCWDLATHRRTTLKGEMVTCWGCGIVGESVPLPGAEDVMRAEGLRA